MNTTTIAPEVQEFLDAVRAQLADLDLDEQREILDGLEADLTDLVAERGRGALGDPVAYADELRAAAGLEPQADRRRVRVALPVQVHGLLDRSHHGWDRLVGALPGDAAGLLTSLRPAWWVLRGWIAVEAAALWLGDWSLTVVPGGERPAGVLAVAAAVILSVQLGRDRLWPAGGWRRVAMLRVLLLGLNCLALVMLPIVLNGLEHGKNAMLDAAYARAHVEQEQLDQARFGSQGTDRAGLYLDGTWVSNIYPYDAKGRPLVGVQLFNQVGKPINVITQAEVPDQHCIVDETGKCQSPAEGVMLDEQGRELFQVSYPWTNGATQLFNVFPIPSRVQVGDQPSATAFTEENPPAVGAFPLASVPTVSLPGIKPSVLRAADR